MKKEEPVRCPWCLGDEVYTRYHDKEWGVRQHNNRRLFEALILDGAQAGLSWITILKRREGYRAAFDNFDIEKMASYTDRDVARLMADERIIRNRRKIESAIGNARACIALAEKEGSLSKWLWKQVDGRPVVNHWKTLAEVPPSSELSERVSKELKGWGFTFVGPTIIYAFMQAEGFINDHLVSCYRFKEVQEG